MKILFWIEHKTTHLWESAWQAGVNLAYLGHNITPLLEWNKKRLQIKLETFPGLFFCFPSIDAYLPIIAGIEPVANLTNILPS